MTLADFMMAMIYGFDRGKPESAIYDASAGETLAAFLDHFKAVKIVSTDPLVIETYDDLWFLDAENSHQSPGGRSTVLAWLPGT